MEFCKYHPVISASYQCVHCHTLNCDDCVNDINGFNHSVCFLCQKELNKLDTSYNITPFWRRLQESFHYPLSFDPLLLILGISVLTALASFMPFSIVFNLLLTSALFKYSFSCLVNTSKGYLKAPDMSDAYGGGFGLVFQLIFIVLMVLIVIGLTYSYIGPMIGSVIGIILIIGFPAIIINFAITDNMLLALNPANMFKLITSIGLPYGLLLAFVMIMTASVSIISQFIGNDYSIVSVTLQSAVSNYYMIVFFHIMGYMIYQYQSELDYDTSLNHQEFKESKTVLEKTIANIDVFLKEGKYDSVITLYKEAIQSYPNESSLKPNFFELLLATKNTEQLDLNSAEYFEYLLNSSRTDQVSLTYKRILKVYPKYNPDTAELRVKIANICMQSGDAKAVIRLLNGIQKAHPQYEGLVEAFELMAQALDTLPNMQKQATACRAFIVKLKAPA